MRTLSQVTDAVETAVADAYEIGRAVGLKDRTPTAPRFITRCTQSGYIVHDRQASELDLATEATPVAGPYRTRLQAVYVAYILSDDPTSTPYAPDPDDTVDPGAERWARRFA